MSESESLPSDTVSRIHHGLITMDVEFEKFLTFNITLKKAAFVRNFSIGPFRFMLVFLNYKVSGTIVKETKWKYKK